jgi:SET domain-containing protein
VFHPSGEKQEQDQERLGTSLAFCREMPSSKQFRKQSPNPVELRGSGVHGKGVFATRKIVKGTRIIEYTGRRISWKKAKEMRPLDPKNPNRIVFFALDDGSVIDPSVGGNDTQWINHSCEPNCETIEKECRIYVMASRDLNIGEELFIDYSVEAEGQRTKKLERKFRCDCGTPNCRGTMLGAA